MENPYNKPPVLILGGAQNSVSIARSLGRNGVKVYLSVRQGENALFSRFVRQSFPYTDSKNVHGFWKNLLFNPHNQFLQGSIIFPCNDDAVEFVALNQDRLKTLYLLEDSDPKIRLAMLDKKMTLQMAESLGIPTPRFWEIEDLEIIKEIAAELLFPVIIKPLNSHKFQKVFPGRKFFKANNLDELIQYSRMVLEVKIKIMICELIPGPDDLLGSYYTFIDSTGKPLFHFTKKIIRRYPKNEGLACYHKTNWDPEIAGLGLKFFEGINFRGLGNIEFKRDPRDDQLKVIECNPRFTAAQELIVQSGLDIALIIYNKIAGSPVPIPKSYKNNIRFWFPQEDFKSFLELKRKGEITFVSWIRGLLYKQVFPFFQWSDPLPSWIPFLIQVKNYLKKVRVFK